MNQGLETLEGRANSVRVVILVFLLITLATMALEIGQLGGAVDLASDTALTGIAGLIYIGYTVVFVVSIVLISMWIHRAHANLFEAGLDGLEFTPGWSVGWFFIPIANLFKPFQAMRELWNRSHDAADSFGAETPSQVGTWWGCYVGGSIFSNIAFRLELSAGAPTSTTLGLGLVGSALLIGSAWYLKQIVEDVTAAQRSVMGLADTFA